MTQPCIWWSVMIVFFFTMFEPIEQSTKAFDEYAIVTSETNAKSYWVDETSELQGNFSLTNCTDFGLTYVGLVKPEGQDQANEALDRIFDKLNTAYSGNHEEQSLEVAVYGSNDEVDSFVKSSEFQKRGLCFVIGWNTFDVE